MPVSVATIIGISTEGYKIASSLVLNKVRTFLVDENLQMGMEMKPDLIKSYPTVHSFLDDEPLTGVHPMGKAVNDSKFIFFTPRIRRKNETSKTETNDTIKEIGKDLSKDTSFIMNLPMGVGQNSETIFMLERLSGMQEGKDFQYIYAPLKPRSTEAYTLGLTDSKINKDLVQIFDAARFKTPSPLMMQSSEMYFARIIIEKYGSLTADIEFFKRLEQKSDCKKIMSFSDYRDEYLDDISENLLDLRGFGESFETGDPLLYQTNGALKSIDGFLRRLTDETKRVFKIKGLKASKTRIILVWSMDPYEMRGDRHILLGNLISRFGDYVSDVESLVRSTIESENKSSLIPILSSEKSNVVIFCSDIDVKACSKELIDKNLESNRILMKANLVCEVIG